jgi:hypothetical protein
MCKYECNIGARSRHHCYRGNAISMKYSVCVSSVACPALSHFSTLSHKRHDFRKNLLNIKCGFWFPLQLLSEIFLILRRIQRDITINVHRSSCNVPLFLSDFNGTWISPTDFRKIFEYQISWKSVEWEPSCSVRTDRQTWRSLFS